MTNVEFVPNRRGLSPLAYCRFKRNRIAEVGAGANENVQRWIDRVQRAPGVNKPEIASDIPPPTRFRPNEIVK